MMKRVQKILLLSVLCFVPVINAALADSSIYSDQYNYYTVKSGDAEFTKIEQMRHLMEDKYPDTYVNTKNYLNKKDIILTAFTDKLKDENQKEAFYTINWGNYSSLDEAIRNFDIIKQELTVKQHELHWIEYIKSILCEAPIHYRVNAGGGGSEAVKQLLELIKPQFPDASIKTDLIKKSNVLKAKNRQKLESFDNEQKYYFVEAGKFDAYQRAEEAYEEIAKIKNMTAEQLALLRIEKPRLESSEGMTTTYQTYFGIGSKEEMVQLQNEIKPSFPAAKMIEKQIKKVRIIKMEDEDYQKVDVEELAYTLQISKSKSFELADDYYGKSLQLKKDENHIPWIESVAHCECRMPTEFLIRIGTDLNPDTLDTLQAGMEREYPNAMIETATFPKPQIIWTSMQKSEFDGIDNNRKYHTIRLGEFMPDDAELISKRLMQQFIKTENQNAKYHDRIFVKQKDEYKKYDKDTLGQDIRNDILERGVCPSYAFSKAVAEGNDFCLVLLATGYAANDSACSCIKEQFYAGASERFAKCTGDLVGGYLCPQCPINVGSVDASVGTPVSPETP